MYAFAPSLFPKSFSGIRRRQCISPVLCAAQPQLETSDVPPSPRAVKVRQSLPTSRERRWLAERYIGRAPGQRIGTSTQEAFKLTVWSLGLEHPSHEVHYADEWRSPVTGISPDAEDRDNQDVSVEGEVGSFLTPLADGMPARDAEGAAIARDLQEPTRLGGVTESEADRLSPMEVPGRNARSARETEQPTTNADPIQYPSPRAPSGQGWRAGTHLGSRSRTVVSSLTRKEAKEVLIWAYIARVVVSKAVLGKRAVTRNLAKRRVTAALRTVLPAHACRGREYFFQVFPPALVIPLPLLVEQAERALRECRCWSDDLSPEALQRPRYRRMR